MGQEYKGSKIISIGTAVPEHAYEQSHLASWMHEQLCPEDDQMKRKFEVLYRKTKITKRHSVLPDFYLEKREPVLFKTFKEEPLVQDRLAVYADHALPLAIKAAQNCFSKIEPPEITHLVVVSCTGMSAPGLEIQMKQELKLGDEVQCHAVNFVGCYAAFPALNLADAFCKADSSAVVLVVAIELCTLHFQNKASDDHLLSNSLFSDGAAAALVTGRDSNYGGLIIEKTAQLLLPRGKDDMAWNIHSEGFLMKLSAYIPALVDSGIRQLIGRLLDDLSLPVSAIQHWAVHPGGRKILEVIEKELNLDPTALASSYHTLNNYGNMSAPTILFVLQHQLESNRWKQDDFIFACGFGPGLTLAASLFKFDDYA